MIYMFIFMFVRVLSPRNLLHFVVYPSSYVDFGTRRVAVLGLRWLIREMKRGNNAFYDAEIDELVGQARFRIEGHPFWMITHDA